jgi:hypothetical protein
VLLNTEAFSFYTSLYDFSAMIPWMKENGRIVCQEHGCVMTMMIVLMEKMNMPVHVTGKAYIIMGSDMPQLQE